MSNSDTSLEFRHSDPHNLAYLIRQGIKAAGHFAVKDGQPVEPYASYHKLGSRYILRAKRGVVEAELRDRLMIDIVRNDMKARIVINNVADELEIVGAIIKHKANEMFFPGANEDALETVYEYAKKHEYYLVWDKEAGLTVTKTHPGEAAWQPTT